MHKVAKSYRNKHLDIKSARFKSLYGSHVEAIDKLLHSGTGMVEVQFRDSRAAARWRYRCYEFMNITDTFFTVVVIDPYTLSLRLRESKPVVLDDMTIDGKPVKSIITRDEVEALSAEPELTPEQEEQVAEVMRKLAEEERKETDTDSFIKNVFGKGSRDDKEGDKP